MKNVYAFVACVFAATLSFAQPHAGNLPMPDDPCFSGVWSVYTRVNLSFEMRCVAWDERRRDLLSRGENKKSVYPFHEPASNFETN